MRLLMLGLIGILCFGHATPAGAAVLFQSIPHLNASPSGAGLCSGCADSTHVYDDFTLAGSDTITEIDFAVSIVKFTAQPITVGIYTVSNGLPATEIFSTTFSSYTYTAGSALTKIIDVFPADWSLAAGTYDITFFNGTLLNVSDFAQAGRALYQAGTPSRMLNGYSTAFALIGSPLAVPEPLSIALFGLALIALAAVSRQRPRPVKSSIVVRRPNRRRG